MTRILILAPALFVACDGDVQYVEDLGSACVAPLGGEEQNVGDDEALAITVSFPCDGSNTTLDGACTVVRTDDVLEVSAWVEYTTDRDQSEPVCMSPQVTCTTEPLPEGSYVVRYAGTEATIDVPGGDAPAVCTPEAN